MDGPDGQICGGLDLQNFRGPGPVRSAGPFFACLGPVRDFKFLCWSWIGLWIPGLMLNVLK